jgi:acetyl esterase/lipase
VAAIATLHEYSILPLKGGAWLQGNKGHSPPMLTYLAQRGIVCVSAQYRLLDDEKHAFPVNLVDIKHCVVWLRRNAHKFGADPNFIVSCGGSAGGHLAALLALTNDERDRSLLQPGFTSEDTRVQACVSFYAPLDLGQDPTDTIDGLRDW